MISSPGDALLVAGRVDALSVRRDPSRRDPLACDPLTRDSLSRDNMSAVVMSADPRAHTVALQEDARLLQRIGQGDREAFRRFYERHAGRVLAALGKLCRDRVLAEDLLQEVFLAVWRKAASYRRERGDPGGWLFVIARNKAADARRRARPTTGEEGCDTAAAPAAAGGKCDLRITLEQALAVLSAEQRQAVNLAYFGGYTYEETAARLNLPLGTLKSRIRTGLRRLRTTLQEG